ncbi:hypothetical protein K227x_41240 [Rubripirellula lacrimiformis]|uniref:Uncharacterized protein n=1 Tax=Rubripirellula lacrimiformis TaxID=1930273 RepID=A0A517NF11_9BACT|nr:hypothetical protein K227x_41240 [Rubripirellula lacrimiformis]
MNRQGAGFFGGESQYKETRDTGLAICDSIAKKVSTTHLAVNAVCGSLLDGFGRQAFQFSKAWIRVRNLSADHQGCFVVID